MINIHGYEIFRKDRNRHGGGVTIYVLNNDLTADIININDNNNVNYCCV
jgi:hypothetical protein